MYPRINYELTDKELVELLEASKPTPVMKIGSYTGGELCSIQK